MADKVSESRLLSAEALAEARWVTQQRGYECDWDMEALLDHIDALEAELAQLREAVQVLAKGWGDIQKAADFLARYDDPDSVMAHELICRGLAALTQAAGDSDE